MRATLDIGAGGHVMPAEMFPRVKTESHDRNKEIRCSNWRKIEDLGEKTLTFKSVEEVHRCIKLRSCKRCEALDLNQ